MTSPRKADFVGGGMAGAQITMLEAAARLVDSRRARVQGLEVAA